MSKPYYLMVAFWGARYREAFYSLSLSSLLSPNNIPALAAIPGCKFIICTTSDDWDALQRRPLIEELRKYMDPLFVDIGYPGPNGILQIHMSKGHRLAAQRAIDDGAWAGFVAPDLLVSDGMIPFVLDKARQGKRAVLTPALRYAMEPVMEALRRDRLVRPDQPLVLQPRYLAGIAQGALHSEIRRYEFEAPYFGQYPIWSWWKVPRDQALVIHTVSWALLLGDFGSLKRHNDRRLYDSTIDGFYVYENFFKRRQPEELYLSADSDEVMFMGLTSESELTYPLEERAVNRSSRATHDHLCEIHRFLRGKEIDEFRRWAYQKPFHVHGAPLSPHGDRTAERSTEIVQRALSLPLVEKVAQALYWSLIRYPIAGLDPEELPQRATALGLFRYFAIRASGCMAWIGKITFHYWYDFERRILLWSFGWLVRPVFSHLNRPALAASVGMLPRRYRRAVLRRLKPRKKSPLAGLTVSAASEQQPERISRFN